MQQKTITIQNKLGLHARAAMKFTDTAARYQSRIAIHCNERKADGKSIMEVMVIGASLGHDIELVVEGDDEHDALQALETLIMSRFGEPE
jgi:phosphocarrier protein HPr